MANTLREVLVRISANSTGLDRELTTSLGKMKRFGAEAVSLGQTFAIGASLPITAFGAAAIKAAGDLDALERGLKATTKETGPLSNQLERLRQIAKLPGLGFQEAVQGSINLQAVGLSAATSERYIKVFGNALASVGRGKADLDGVIVQLQQMSGKSKVLAEDVKPLVQRVPQLAAAMQKLFGTIDTEQLQKMGITSKQFVNSIVGELEKLPQATGGVKNAFENLADSSNQALAKVGKVLVENLGLDTKIEAFGQAIENAGTAFARMSPFAQNAAISIGGVAAAAPLAAIAIGTLIEKTGTVIGFFRTWETAAVSLKFALVALAAAGIYAVVAAWRDMNGAQQTSDKWNRIYTDSVTILEGKLRQHGVSLTLLREEYDKGRITQDQYAAALRKLALQTGELNKPVAAVTTATVAHAAAVKTSAEALEAWGGPLRRTVSDLERQLDALDRLRAAQKAYADTLANPIDIADIKAPDVMNKEQQRAADEALRVWKESQQQIEGLDDALKRGAEQYPKIGKAAKSSGAEQKTVWGEVSEEVDRGFNHIARGIADSIVKWNGFGNTMKSVAQSTASGVLEIFIKQLFKPLEEKMASIASGKILNAVGGGGSSAISGGAGAAGSIGSIGGVGGGAGSAAVSAGLNATLGTIFAGVGAAAGIGNILVGMKQEGTMNQIERNTAAASIHLLNILEKANTYWPELASIRGYLWDTFTPALQSLMTTVESMAAGSNQKIVIQIDGKTVAEVLARSLSARSPAFA